MTHNLMRDENWIVVPMEGAVFPLRCFKTNEDVEAADFKVCDTLQPTQVIKPKSKTASRVEMAAKVAIGNAGTAIAQFAQERRLTWHVGLKKDLQRKTKRKKQIGLALVVLGPILGFLIGMAPRWWDPILMPGESYSDVPMYIGQGFMVVVVVGGLVIYGLGTVGVIRINFSDGEYVWLDGAGKEFLNTLPDSPIEHSVE